MANTGWNKRPVDGRTNGRSFAAAPEQIFPTERCRFVGVFAVGLIAVVSSSPGLAQAPPTLGSVAPFAVLGGTAVTNTGPTTLVGTAARPGDVGVFPGSSFSGSGSVTFATGGVQDLGNATASQAQVDLLNAYQNLASRPASVNLTGQNLGGLTLVPGVYTFSSAAQLTGTVNLNGLGNPNSVFIFNIASALTTASGSTVTLLNSAQGSNVFWRVGSSATLGTGSSFTGDILAQSSITLDTAATITCGAAWAHTGAVTLDTNTISLCDLITTPPSTGVIIGPTGLPLFTSLLPPSATPNEVAVAKALDNAVAGGATLPLAYLNLYNLAPTALENALTQISGEAGNGPTQAGVQSMNSFLSMVTNPFDRGLAPEIPLPRPPIIYKAPAYYKAPNDVAPDPRRWSVWAAGYGGNYNTTGNAPVGSHDISARAIGFATGLDYRVTPYTVAGFALAGGGTNYGLSDGLGGGRSDMFQSAVYSVTRVGPAYIATALAYAWHHFSTDRFVTVAGTDHLTADFSANNIAGRIEGGYRFAVPDAFGLLPGLGVTPYAAFQMQAFRTPSYSETAASGSSAFALDYDAHTTTTFRTELGAWFDERIVLDHDAVLTLRSRAAWAYDYWRDYNMTATFQQLPGSTFTVLGAAPMRDSLLASAGAEISFRNGISIAGLFDGDFAENSRMYSGFVRLRYSW